jgi:hypothetical protein
LVKTTQILGWNFEMQARSRSLLKYRHCAQNSAAGILSQFAFHSVS